MNYAWANPTTGLREQTGIAHKPDDILRLQEEARRRAWEALQSTPDGMQEVQICEQITCGSITQQSFANVDLSEVRKVQWDLERIEFAFCHPLTGARVITSEWPSYLKDVLAEDPVGFISEVVIYASRPAFTVHRSDPEPPPQPDPAAAREHPELDDLDALHQQVSSFIDIEQGNPAPKATALALIDIARSLRRLLGEFTPPEPPPFRLPQRTQAEALADYDFTWDKLKAVCTCTGDGLTADGAYCVCPAGMQRKRAAAVTNRSLDPSSILGGTVQGADIMDPANPASPSSPLNPANPASPFHFD